MLPLWNDADTGVRVVQLTGSNEEEELIEIFEEIADAEGWEPGNTLYSLRRRSVLFGLEIHGNLAGGLQLVLPNASGWLPCQTVWPEVEIDDASRSAHVAIMALQERYRGHGMVFWKLVIEMWRHCVGAGIATLYLEVTPRVLCIYKRLGWPLRIVGDRRSHWGEECFLCTLSVAEVAERLLLRAEQSPYYRQIIAQAFRVAITRSDDEHTPFVRERAAPYYAVC